ncbi:hypothetical protein WA026_021725 [Henosepilachna vigintioctopunctata]|uniref:Uncharacterized protein n=1 Tax=Henosepilachna vigintioctopunctata TaxID=420089 RepID=A0AAW1TSC3_9CUCU
MSPVSDELMCPGDVISNETGKRIPGNVDNVMGLDQNMLSYGRQGIDIQNREEEGPEKVDSDVTDKVVEVMSNNDRKVTNLQQWKDYKVSSDSCPNTQCDKIINKEAMKDQSKSKGRRKRKNKSLKEIEMSNGLGYMLAPEGMRAQQSKRPVKGLRDSRQLRRAVTGHDVLVRALKPKISKIRSTKVFDLYDKRPILKGEWKGIIEDFANNGESFKGKTYSCVKGFDKKLWFSKWE